MEPPETVAAFLDMLDIEVLAVAPGAWGLTLEAGGFDLDIRIALRGPLLRAQAAVVPAGVIDPHQLLYWNQQAPLVCFAEDGDGQMIVCGELPLESVAEETLDRFLGLLVASAARAREFVTQRG